MENKLDYYSDYFEALIWADVEESEDIKGSYTIYDIEQASLVKHLNELDAFFDQAQDILDNSDYTHEQACHDFYLTRQRHGVGFWENDHCNEEQGEKLTALAKAFSIVYISEHNGKLILD